MSLKTQAINPAISNISWYRGNATNPIGQSTVANYGVTGNPNHPARLNSDPNAGPIVTFDISA